MTNIQLVHNNSESNFYQHLELAIKTSESFLFSVAFISDSAIQLLTDAFTECEEKGVTGKILTTNYMFGTHPNALKRLLSFSNIETRIYHLDDNGQKGFHTKGYIFENESDYKVIVGSSNLTSRAMKTNFEWNISYISKTQKDLSSRLIEEFDAMWELPESVLLTAEYIEAYEQKYYENYYSTKKQTLFLEQLVEFLKDYGDLDFVNKMVEAFDLPKNEIFDNIDTLPGKYDYKPNRMQEIALEGLYKIRQNGGDKGLIIAATGTGKTFLAAFDALQFEPKKLLFIVHREKILKDAERTFKKVISNIKTGLYTGNYKELNNDYIFASIQTLSREANLYSLNADHFDYIVIDEAHRAAAPTYQKVLNHFKPKFLLGMTATPERTDANSIFELFDNQVAAEIRLRDALRERMVVPFHYFGITDAVADLRDIDVNKEIDELSKRLNIKARVDLIVENIQKYRHSGNKTKALGFCADVNHANYMADSFNDLGINSIALTGLSSQEEREISIRRLEDDSDPLSYIFTVDIFNEGIDIPSVNLVLMLRPTQSPIIFTQQLGRGLRLHDSKEYLTILDFIGAHNKTFMIALALVGDSTYDKDDLLIETENGFPSIPGEVFIRLDEISKNRILHQLEKYNFDDLKNLKDLYFNVKKDVKNIPSILDFGFDGLDPVRFIDKSRSYFEFIQKVDSEFTPMSIDLFEDFTAISRFIDSLLPHKRIYEAAILGHLLSNVVSSKELLFQHMFVHVNNPDREDFEHAISHLTLDLLNKLEQKKYIPLIVIENNEVSLSPALQKVIEDRPMLKYIKDSIDYGIKRYNHEFGRVQSTYPNFTKYQKYKNREITQIRRDNSIFVIQQGLSRHGNNYFLLVTLEKGEVKESLNYADRFIDNKTFEWESPNHTRELSDTGQNLIHHKERGINIHLFVKKGGRNSDIYSKELIYLGTAEVIDHKNEKPIKFTLRLHQALPKDIYLRLTKEYKIDEEN